MTAPSVTIIAYHAIDEGPGPVCLRREVFDRQVRGLVDAGCTFLPMSEVLRHLSTGTAFPDRAVALSFDDAYESVHRHALPLLDRLGVTATVYPVTSELGGRNRWDAATGAMPELPLVTVGQLHELMAGGWEVGGHTHTHRALPTLAPHEVADELTASNAILEDTIGSRVSTFAYPYGRHDASTRAAARSRYDACLDIGAARARLGTPLDRVGRVDAWYLQREWQTAALAHRAGDVYLASRRAARALGLAVRRRKTVNRPAGA